MSGPPPTKEELAAERRRLRKEDYQLRKLDSRFSLPFTTRLPVTSGIAMIVGLALGASHGSQLTGLRFRAEHAHRLPTTPTGWYLYHRTKNYKMALGGLREGLRMGFKVSFWTAGFFSIEEIFDLYRGTKDFLNTTIASLAIAGGFSLWNRFPITTAARTAKTGLIAGIAYGLAQDAIGVAKGRRPGYVDFILRRGRRKPSSEPKAMA